MTATDAIVLPLVPRAEPAAGSELALDDRAADLLFREAHTTYGFTDEPVAESTLRAIHDLVKWAPTGMNASPLRVTIVGSQEARDRLLRHVLGGNTAKIQSAPITAILSYDVDYHQHMPQLQPHDLSLRDRMTDERVRDRQASFNAALQAGYFILGVRAAGLAAGPMGGFDRGGVDAEFFPEGRQHSFLLVNIGHSAPDGTKPRSPRLDFEQVFTTL